MNCEVTYLRVWTPVCDCVECIFRECFIKILYFVHFLVTDPRTNSWFMVGNPLYICSIVFAYAYFVLKCGAKFMEKREPYSLKSFIFYYNIFQIVSNSTIVYVMYTAGWTTEFTLGCEPMRTSTRSIDMRVSKRIA